MSAVDLIILLEFNPAQWLVAMAVLLEMGVLLVVMAGLLDMRSQG